ncbi:MAG: Lrp/AsnC family transcriptional regulator for asnA, asnC and gidA, partial [Chitinophagales bacterium]
KNILMIVELDSLDKDILNLMKENSKLPYAEMASQLHSSVGTIHTRIKKMERLGVIQKTDIQINYGLLGYDITCFIGIYLNKSRDYDQVVKGLQKINEITDLHYTTGQYSMFAKLVLKDTQHLREILHDQIQTIEGVQRTDTLLSLHQSLKRKIKLT